MLPKDYALEDYHIQDVLGVGGFGITYVATDDTLQETVAIKEFMPAGIANHVGDTVQPLTAADQTRYDRLLQDFLTESRNIARIRHPNVVRVRRYFKRNGTAYMVMDYEEGVEFQTWLRDLDRLPTEAETVRILRPLLDGLQAVHGVGLVHRDIKPQNIFIRRSDGSPVLLDFGAARLEDASHFTAILTAGYAPIEQYEENVRQGPWTDIYGLAAVLYRAITGTKPQAALTRMALDRLVPVTDACRGAYSEAFLRGIDRGLLMNPEDRPRTIAEWRAGWIDPAESAPPPTPARAAPARHLPDAGLEPSAVPVAAYPSPPVALPVAPPATADDGEDEFDDGGNASPPAAQAQPSWAPVPVRTGIIEISADASEYDDDSPRRFEVSRPSWAVLGQLGFLAFVEVAVAMIILRKALHGDALLALPLAFLVTAGLSTVFAKASRELNWFSCLVWGAAGALAATLLLVLVFGRLIL